MTDDRGTAAIEFGLVFPLLATLLAGTADLGRALWLHHALTKSAETAGRYLARTTDPTNAAAQATAATLAATAQAAVATFAVTASGDATLVTTTATAVFTPVTGLLFSGGITMQVSHVERWLGQ